MYVPVNPAGHLTKQAQFVNRTVVIPVSMLIVPPPIPVHAKRGTQSIPEIHKGINVWRFVLEDARMEPVQHRISVFVILDLLRRRKGVIGV